MTPQPMDIAEVAGELQRKLKLEETADEAERTNPQFCTEYIHDIYHYLRDLEVSTLQYPLANCNIPQILKLTKPENISKNLIPMEVL